MSESTYQLLLYGAIVKDKGNGRRFYDALKQATVDELERARARLEPYRHYQGSHEAKRYVAIKRRLAEMEEQARAQS